MRKIFLLSIMLCLQTTFAQTKLRKAEKAYETFAYTEAAALYGQYLADAKEPSAETISHAADAYYNIGDDRNALTWYKKLYEVQGQSMTDADFYRYTNTLRAVNDHADADKLTKAYLDRKGDTKEIARFNYQRRAMDSLNTAQKLYTLKNLEINSPKSDFGAAYYGEQKVIYASSKDTTRFGEKRYTWNNQPFLDLYVSDRNASDGSLFAEKRFLPEIMTQYHEATAAITPDNKTIFFTANKLNKKDKLVVDKTHTNQFQLLRANLDGEKAGKPEKLFFNGDDYSVGHPAVSEDGKWLFFVSDIPGGSGETDIYVATIQDGVIGTPQNLGASVNSPGREMFPYYRNGVLYFSSDGWYGYGGLDVYSSKMTGTAGNLKFSAPQNLGQPLNSNKDDFAYIVDAADATGYVSSNRVGGKGDDDIYSFTKVKPICNAYVSGLVRNAKSKAAIAMASVKAYDAFGDVVAETSTDNEGKYKLTVPCFKKYKFVASKANHSSDEKEVEGKGKNESEIPDINFELSNYDDLIVKDKGIEKVAVNPIFFNYDKWDITPQAAEELDKVVFIMQKFPNIRIKIESHTDSRGKDAYNLKLSDNRAKSTQTYIVGKGIDASRIESAIGYGESRLTNRCKNGVKCTEAEHFKNRRSDFIIIQK